MAANQLVSKPKRFSRLTSRMALLLAGCSLAGASAVALVSGGTDAPETKPAQAAPAPAASPPAPAYPNTPPGATADQPAATGDVFIVPSSSVDWTALMEYSNAYGRVGVATVDEKFDTKNYPFFNAGPNKRACVTCHQPANAMSLSIDTIRSRWAATGGKDPMFAAVDGSNCPDLPQDQADSHSLLLTRGVFRIRLPWPPRKPDGTPIEPDFKIEVVSDPTGCNTSPVYGLNSPHPTVSVFRRPRMAANLRYVDRDKYHFNGKINMPLERDPESGAHSSMQMMADARATSLKQQIEDAMRTHLGMEDALSEDKINKILDFEKRVYVAATFSKGAGNLTEPGHPKALGVQAMVTGEDHINGSDDGNAVFWTFDQWAPGGTAEGATPEQKVFRASVARGYDIFYRRPFWLGDIVGINNIRLGNPYKQTCSFCHEGQLTGVDNNPGWMDIGTENFPHAPPAPDLPRFKITCKDSADPHPYLGRVIYTNDPGRALVSGRCEDVGGIVMQQFRGISARAPYFANGSAKSLLDVINYYDRRFNIGYSEQDKTDLVNFFSVL